MRIYSFIILLLILCETSFAQIPVMPVESAGDAEPITKRDAELTYGTDLMNLITLARAIDLSIQFVGGGITTPRSPKGITTPKNITPSKAPSTQKPSNPWNNFLRENTGVYSGKDWIKRAAEDYWLQKIEKINEFSIIKQ